MGDLSKLKLGIGQLELVDGWPSRNEAACDRMIEQALDHEADALVVPYSLSDPSQVRLIGLNDSRIDIAGNVVLLDACGETYRIGIGDAAGECDFSIRMDLEPYTLEASAERFELSTIVVRPVGMRECGKKVLAYNGGSLALSSQGVPLARLHGDFEEDFALIDFSRQTPCDEAGCPSLLDALVYTMKRFDRQVLPHGPKWVIGLSGGLDSSITAALLVLAFGNDRVVAYNMATRYNTLTTKANASSLAQALDIPLRNGSIEDLVVALGNTLVQYGYPASVLKDVVLENAQARTRGNLLSTFAAVEGGVVVNNGNRIECALGYATLYGDAIGALAPIADLTKVQLFDLAREINERFGVEAVPENLLPSIDGDALVWPTMPSAELAKGQYDPMKWFYHDWLIPRLLGDGEDRLVGLDEAACTVLEHYADTKLLDTEVARWVRYYGLDDPKTFAKDLSWVLSSMRRSAFKRIQSPPAITIASKASLLSGPAVQAAEEPSTRFNALLRAVESMN